jgi:hypothetical protein
MEGWRVNIVSEGRDIQDCSEVASGAQSLAERVLGVANGVCQDVSQRWVEVAKPTS